MTEKEIEILRQVLGDYISTKRGKELNFLCPFPKCNKRKKKLAVNKDSGNWHCWSCERKGIEPDYLVARFGSVEHIRIWGELTKRIDFSILQDFLFPSNKNEETKNQFELPKEFISLVGNHSLSSLAARNYLENRNVLEKDICLWKIGYCQTGRYANRIVFPSFDVEGNLNYFTTRSYIDSERKYDNPSAEKKEIIFNELLIDFDKPVDLVEGPFDALIAGDNAIPLLGSFLRPDFKLLKRIVERKTMLYLALDPDAKKKEKAIIKLLKELGIQMKKVEISPFQDVGSMSKEEYQIRRNNAKPIKEDSLLHDMLKEI
jgi:DNA primase